MLQSTIYQKPAVVAATFRTDWQMRTNRTPGGEAARRVPDLVLNGMAVCFLNKIRTLISEKITLELTKTKKEG